MNHAIRPLDSDDIADRLQLARPKDGENLDVLCMYMYYI